MTYVSIVMPVRNEVKFIDRSLGSVLRQDFPSDRMEVFVVDGGSNDGTQVAVQRLADEARSSGWATVRLLDNPAGIASTAMNLALAAVRGDVVIRVDGHCEIDPSYVSACVSLLEQTGADCVGGVLETIGTGRQARAIAKAQSSRFGVGGAAFRMRSGPGGPVDTLAFGAYRRSVFEVVGGFDEELVRNQDDEFNFRLIQKGGVIWLDPTLRTRYFNRSTLDRLARQYFEYGLYKVLVISKRRGLSSRRQLAPPGLVGGFVGMTLVALLSQQVLWILVPTAIYAGSTVIAAVVVGRSDPVTIPLLPVAFLTLHGAYGAGFLVGLWRWRRRLMASWRGRALGAASPGIAGQLPEAGFEQLDPAFE